jgi:hypothetical protein
MSATGGGGPDFEDWLGRQLRLTLGAERGPRPSPAASRYATAARPRGATVPAARSPRLAGLGVRAVACVAAVALGAGGAAAAAAATGSADPVQAVTWAVERCRAEVREQHAGGGGIGQCVSAIASQRGAKRSGAPGADRPGGATTPAPLPGRHRGQQPGGTPGEGNGGDGASGDGAHGAGNPGGKDSSGGHGNRGAQGQGSGPGQGHGQSASGSSSK